MEVEKVQKSENGGYFNNCTAGISLVYQLILNVLLLCIAWQAMRLRSEVQQLRMRAERVVPMHHPTQKVEPPVHTRNESYSQLQVRGPARLRDKKEVISGTGSWFVKHGAPGNDGRDGKPGVQGPRGPSGAQADNIGKVEEYVTAKIKEAMFKASVQLRMTINDIPTVSGAAYVRWGRTSCPNPLSDMVYNGRMGGSSYGKGGGYNPQCFSDNPEYLTTGSGKQVSEVEGAEYQVKGRILGQQQLTNKNIPCSVCLTEGRTTVLMTPGYTKCPDSSWTKEYDGYLMTGKENHKRTEFICLDKEPEALVGYDDNRNGELFYHTSMHCNNFRSCPPYKDKAELACVVCSK